MAEENKPQNADPKPAPQSSGDALGAAQTELAKANAKLAEVQKWVDERKKAELDDDLKRKETAKKAGEFDKVIEQQNKELANANAKLVELRDDATLGKSYRERETARIEAAKKALTEAQQRIIDAQPSVDLKAQLIDEFAKAAKSGDGKTPAKADGAGGPPAAATDWSAIQSREQLEAAKQANPKGFADLVAGMFGGKKRPTTLDTIFAPSKASAGS